MALYQPPTRVSSREFPWLALVSQADPDWQRRKHREVEYEASGGKVFYADPYRRGAYNDHSNIYDVGQPYGADDPLVTAARAPTVGNPVPGLYQGVATAGWA